MLLGNFLQNFSNENLVTTLIFFIEGKTLQIFYKIQSDIQLSEKNHTLTFGAPQPKLDEIHGGRLKQYKHERASVVKENHSVQWRKPLIDVAELVTKRYLEGWQVENLCQHFGRSRDSLQWAYLDQKKKGFKHRSISPELRQELLAATQHEEWMRKLQFSKQGVKNA